MRLRRGRPKALIVLILLSLFVSLLWGVASRRARAEGRIMVLDSLGISLVAPISSGAGSVWRALSRYLWALTHLRALLKENERLRRQLEEERARNVRLEEYFRENRRLLSLLRMKPRMRWRTTAARVVGRSLSNWSKVVVIDKGRKDGVRPGDVVMAGGALVGRVTEAGRSVSRVLLITDRQSGVGAMVQRSRELGIVKGTGGRLCVMQYLRKEADVRRGDRVITSGVGSIFPEGILVGRVVAVRYDPERGTLSAVVKPSADLVGVEEVFVVKAVLE